MKCDLWHKNCKPLSWAGLLCSQDNEQLAKLQKHYGEPELEWLKLVATHLVESEEKVEKQTNLINLCLNGGNNSSQRKMTVEEAGASLELFTAAGYLMKVKQGRNQFVKYGLGPRFMVEMEDWLRQTFEEDVWECGKCKKVGMIGEQSIHLNRISHDRFLHFRCEMSEEGLWPAVPPLLFGEKGSQVLSLFFAHQNRGGRY